MVSRSQKHSLYFTCSLIALYYLKCSDAFFPVRLSLKPPKRANVILNSGKTTFLRLAEENDDVRVGSENALDALVATWNKYFDEVQKRNVGGMGLRENYDAFGTLAPLAKIIDERTGGWGLGYADTTPYTDKTFLGIVFLSTNLFFFWAGLNLYENNNYALAAALEVAGLFSLYYHWCQVHYGPQRDEVRLPLLIDYTAAFITINLTFIDLILLLVKFKTFEGCEFPVSSIFYGLAGIFCLIASWVLEYGLPYMVLHGFWHAFSALSAAIIGSTLTNGSCG